MKQELVPCLWSAAPEKVRMKGGLHTLTSIKVPVIFFSVVCMTLLMWCEKTSFLTALLSSQNGMFLLPGYKLSSEAKDEMLNNHEGQTVYTKAQNFSEEDPIDARGAPSGGGNGSGDGDKGFDAVSSASSVKLVSMVNTQAEEKLPNRGDDKTCNYAQGEWVKDDSRPFYSGSGCKQWLSEMWACRLTQRTDFAYEKFRWQPFDCEMEEFEGVKFLRRMRDKTLAFVGDSLGRQQFQSLMCMITGGQHRNDVINVGRQYGLVKRRGAIRPAGWAYRFRSTNTTILYYWSASLCDIEPINKNDPATQYAMHLDRPPAFLKSFLGNFDVLVLNTGHHWNRGKLNANRWVMYVGGAPNTNKKTQDIAGAKNFTIHSIVRWVDSQLPQHKHLKAFYRSLSPRHFFHGDWNTGGTCDNTGPLSKGKQAVKDDSSDHVAAMAMKGTKVKLLDITAASELRDEGHISRYSIKGTAGVQDCLHWCLPGVPDVWNEVLFAQL